MATHNPDASTGVSTQRIRYYSVHVWPHKHSSGGAGRPRRRAGRGTRLAWRPRCCLPGWRAGPLPSLEHGLPYVHARHDTDGHRHKGVQAQEAGAVHAPAGVCKSPKPATHRRVCTPTAVHPPAPAPLSVQSIASVRWKALEASGTRAGSRQVTGMRRSRGRALWPPTAPCGGSFRTASMGVTL